jgi:hypothetical protein
VTVRPSNIAFHPPESLATPIIMVAAGTGIAPFRGFVQARALRVAAGEGTPGPALLFFGCRAPGTDFLYRDELAAWEQAGVVDVRPAFSRAPGGGGRYVQDRLWQDRAEVIALVERGATSPSAATAGGWPRASTTPACASIGRRPARPPRRPRRGWRRCSAPTRATSPTCLPERYPAALFDPAHPGKGATPRRMRQNWDHGLCRRVSKIA